ncbi:hypothetical protein QR680_014876 [Steinernema hermaphroditum]|uniref:Acid phosphatase n=1 Tax=Steinernema hermaphroditum TaxID=289476 RepID=A0AA39IAD0_9BILA|nr:hypothetical protein QR680_014876 [Steinernema hermaphroditum]
MTSLFSVFLLVSVPLCAAKLDFVQIIFRGGDRSPTRAYPTDPNKGPDVWPNGWSQLTKKGEGEMIELGRYVRQRYIENLTFVDSEFNQDQVYLRTSSKRRNKESVRFFAEALFPNQHVPISSNVPYWEDLLLKPSSVHCETYEKAERQINKEFYKELQHTHGRMFGLLSDKTGMEVDMSTIGDIYSAFYREKIHGLAQPSWINETVYNTVVQLKRVQLLSQYNNPILSKLRSGFLLGDIVRNIAESYERAKLPKFRIFSSHDDTMIALMYNVGIFNEQLIPYASMLIFELHHDNLGHQFVKVFYRNGTDSALQQLSIPGCLFEDCPLSLLKTLMEPRSYKTKDEAVKACGNSQTEANEDEQDSSGQMDLSLPVEQKKESSSGVSESSEGSHITLVLIVTIALLGGVVLMQSICLFRAIGKEN